MSTVETRCLRQKQFASKAVGRTQSSSVWLRATAASRRQCRGRSEPQAALCIASESLCSKVLLARCRPVGICRRRFLAGIMERAWVVALAVLLVAAAGPDRAHAQVLDAPASASFQSDEHLIMDTDDSISFLAVRPPPRAFHKSTIPSQTRQYVR